MKTVAIPAGAMHFLDEIEVLNVTGKKEISAQIVADRAAFEAKGGKVQEVAMGVSGYLTKGYQTTRTSKSRAAERGRKNSMLSSYRSGLGPWK